MSSPRGDNLISEAWNSRHENNQIRSRVTSKEQICANQGSSSPREGTVTENAWCTCASSLHPRTLCGLRSRWSPPGILVQYGLNIDGIARFLVLCCDLWWEMPGNSARSWGLNQCCRAGDVVALYASSQTFLRLVSSSIRKQSRYVPASPGSLFERLSPARLVRLTANCQS